MTNFLKRIFYNYFLRDFSPASLEFIFGTALVVFGLVFGGHTWFLGASLEQATPSGTVMLAALPIILGAQLLLAFLSHDILNQPTTTLYPLLMAAPSHLLAARPSDDGNTHLR